MPFHKKTVKSVTKMVKGAYKKSPVYGFVKTTKTLRKSARTARK